MLAIATFPEACMQLETKTLNTHASFRPYNLKPVPKNIHNPASEVCKPNQKKEE